MKDETNILTGSESEPASSENEESEFVFPDEVTAFCRSPDTSFGFDIMSSITLEITPSLL